MTQTAAPAVPLPIRIPIREIVPWAVFVVLLALIALYFANNYVHEFVHDGRHLLAFPCH